MKKVYGKRALEIFFLSLFFLTGVVVSWSSAEDSHMSKLVEGAKKEGTVMLYTSMSVPDVNKLFEAFRRKSFSFSEILHDKECCLASKDCD